MCVISKGDTSNSVIPAPKCGDEVLGFNVVQGGITFKNTNCEITPVTAKRDVLNRATAFRVPNFLAGVKIEYARGVVVPVER